MKNLSIFLMLTCAFATQAMDDKREQGVPVEGSKLHPIVIDDDEKETPSYTGQSSQKRAKKAQPMQDPTTEQGVRTKEILKPRKAKVVGWASKAAKSDKKARAFLPIKDEKFVLVPMCSSNEYLKNIKIIYDDAQKRGIKEIANCSRELASILLQKMKETREYALDLDFGNFCIRNPENESTMGRVYFENFFPTATGEGFLETEYHLISEFNYKGIGHAILVRLIKDLINPKLGQKCSFMRCLLKDQFPAETEPKGYFESVLMGGYAKRSLLRVTPLDSSALINSYFQAGFGVKVSRRELVMCYPPDSFPPGPPLELHEVESLMKIVRHMFHSRNHKMKLHLEKVQGTDVVPEQVTINLQEMLSAPRVYGVASIEPMKKLYRGLLAVNEPHTFLSVLDILHTEFKMTLEELRSDITVEKALQMLEITELRLTPVPNLDLLREFTKPIDAGLWY